MTKQINIQTVDAEIERLENAATLSTREQFVLDAFNKLQAYQSAEVKFYDVYRVDAKGNRQFYDRVATKPNPAEEGLVYVGLIEQLSSE